METVTGDPQSVSEALRETRFGRVQEGLGPGTEGILGSLTYSGEGIMMIQT